MLARGPGILKTWNPPGCSGCGLCAAPGVHDLSTGGARAAAVLAADTASAHVPAARTAVAPRAAPGRPGEFYLRGLPPRRAVLAGLSGLGLLVTGGYADLDPDGRPALGAHVHADSGITVTGVAKSRFRTATHAVPVQRGSSVRPLFVTAAGMPAADAADLVAHGRPVPAARRAAPRRHPRASSSDRSHHDRRQPGGPTQTRGTRQMRTFTPEVTMYRYTVQVIIQ